MMDVDDGYGICNNHELKCVSIYMKYILFILIDKVAFRLTSTALTPLQQQSAAQGL